MIRPLGDAWSAVSQLLLGMPNVSTPPPPLPPKQYKSKTAIENEIKRDVTISWLLRPTLPPQRYQPPTVPNMPTNLFAGLPPTSFLSNRRAK